MISAAMKQLLKDLTKIYGGFPEHYVVIDTETLGFHNLDLIWGLGALIVENRTITEKLDVVLDWSTHPLVEINWLEKRIASTREQMRAGGRQCHLTLQKLRDEGIKPEDGMEAFGAVLLRARAEKWPIVGHGVIRFDCPRISAQLEEYIGLVYKFRPSEVIDTSAIEKACEMNIMPNPKESFYDFSRRVINKHAPAGMRYNLDRCFEKYGMAAKLDDKDMHSAGGDTLVCHHLLEEYRRLSGV